MVQIGSGAARKTPNVHLTRFAAYFVALNADQWDAIGRLARHYSPYAPEFSDPAQAWCRCGAGARPVAALWPCESGPRAGGGGPRAGGGAPGHTEDTPATRRQGVRCVTLQGMGFALVSAVIHTTRPTREPPSVTGCATFHEVAQ